MATINHNPKNKNTSYTMPGYLDYSTLSEAFQVRPTKNKEKIKCLKFL